MLVRFAAPIVPAVRAESVPPAIPETETVPAMLAAWLVGNAIGMPAADVVAPRASVVPLTLVRFAAPIVPVTVDVPATPETLTVPETVPVMVDVPESVAETGSGFAAVIGPPSECNAPRWILDTPIL